MTRTSPLSLGVSRKASHMRWGNFEIRQSIEICPRSNYCVFLPTDGSSVARSVYLIVFVGYRMTALGLDPQCVRTYRLTAAAAAWVRTQFIGLQPRQDRCTAIKDATAQLGIWQAVWLILVADDGARGDTQFARQFLSRQIFVKYGRHGFVPFVMVTNGT